MHKIFLKAHKHKPFITGQNWRLFLYLIVLLIYKKYLNGRFRLKIH